jgi:hypothetical protein
MLRADGSPRRTGLRATPLVRIQKKMNQYAKKRNRTRSGQLPMSWITECFDAESKMTDHTKMGSTNMRTPVHHRQTTRSDDGEE